MTLLAVHPDDDMLVALDDHQAGSRAEHNGRSFLLLDRIPAKHKVAGRDLGAGELVKMYGMVVGRTQQAIQAGQLLSTRNLVHATSDRQASVRSSAWQPPDVSRWTGRTFEGFVRSDGRVGTRNHWLVIPLVFCENRNLQVMRDAMIDELGYGTHSGYQTFTRTLIERYRADGTAVGFLETPFAEPLGDVQDGKSGGDERLFPNVDGIKFLTHDGGCGGAYADAQTLCGLLAGYVNHPNVAGATVLSLGCQKAQLETFERELDRRNPQLDKPLLIFEQQRVGSEETLIRDAIRHTLAGLVGANQARREPAALSHLVVGLECGGSDGFSGISANPAMGHCSDLLVALGASVILSEFPELAGCENELAARCSAPETAARFLALMQAYEQRCIAEGNGFDVNPSPGNIRDGLITDAMKSAGAARKAGGSPIVDVLDYPEPVTRQGLNLLCTPGGDVESTTAKAGSGATAMLFSTGLGTPTGNPIAPVIKVSSNSELAERMPDIIDCDAGSVIRSTETIEQVGERLLELVIAAASGARSQAERLGQDDFIPWRRSLTF